MNHVPYVYQYPYYANAPMYNYGRQSVNWTYPNQTYANGFNSFRSSNGNGSMLIKDYGPKPFVVNINEATKQNNTYRTALWTGKSFASYFNEYQCWRRYRFGNAS